MGTFVQVSCILLKKVGILCIIICCIILFQSIINESQKYTTTSVNTITPVNKISPKNKLIPEKQITIWSNDFHISPIFDIKDQLASFNVRFIDKSLSAHCKMTNSCAYDLKVLDKDNGISPNMETRKKFYEVYKNDPEINQVDAFACFHPAAMCELFMPFNRSLIVIASTRYELGRFSKEDWTNLNKNLQIIASNPRNVVAGNNLYDAEYIRYFTGIKALVLPSLCDYTHVTYTPKHRKPFIIAPMHNKNFTANFTSMLMKSIQNVKLSTTVGHLRKLYPKEYKYSELVTHPGIIYVPYQVSVMSLFEQYRMNIPLFFPSIDLLTEWQYTYHVAAERTWDGVGSKWSNSSRIPGVLGPDVPDPNNEVDRHAIRYWLQYSDFYQWPHITYYNSIDDLALKLKTTNLKQISENMKIYNTNLKRDLKEKWRQILERISQS